MGTQYPFVSAISATDTVRRIYVSGSWPKLRFIERERRLDGTPIVVVRDGHYDKTRMRRLRLQQANLRSAARHKHFDDLQRKGVR